jgi:hypothetical protein
MFHGTVAIFLLYCILTVVENINLIVAIKIVGEEFQG